MSNTVTAYFKGRVGVAEALYQNDYGIVMAFDGIDLPAHFDCYFTVPGSDTAISGVGADSRVVIPNAVLANSGTVVIHIPLHTGDSDSEVEYIVYFKVIGRARPEDDGTPVQMTAIEQALALLQTPIGNIEQIVNEALSFTGETFDEMQEDLDEWKNGVEGGLTTWKSGVESDFDVLQGQFDTAVAAVTTDTEVTDIRVGADGITDTTAGASVRRQFTDLKADFSETETAVETTSFAERIASDYQIVPFSEAFSNITKYTSLVVYNDTKFITSSGSDSYAFHIPFYGFTFDVMSSTVYVVSSKPQGVANEELSIVEKLTGTAQGDYFKRYTANYPKGSVIVFSQTKVSPTDIGTKIKNHFTMDGLELDAIQDNFLRYSERDNVSTNLLPFTVTKLEKKLVSTTNGTLSANDSYDTYYFKCPVGTMDVSCNNGFRAIITKINPEEITTSGYLVEVVYSNADGRVETFDVELDQYVVISVSRAQVSQIDIRTNLVKPFVLPTMKLTVGQKNFYRIYKYGSETYLYIYYLSGGKVVGWELHNVPSAGINSDTWQLGHIMGYDFSENVPKNGVELVAGGEFELAFKEYGASDYCGGNNHGDENQVDFTLIIDGEKIDLSNADSDYHAFDRIDAIEHALINRCDTPAEDILKHQKIWTFENGTVKVRQTLEFLESLECDFLCCMLAANRSSFTHGVRQGRVEVEDMSTSSYTTISTEGNEMMYLMYGTNASAKITARTCDHTPNAKVWINPASTINKLYYNFFGQLPNTAVANGTVLSWESEYDIAYNA